MVSEKDVLDSMRTIIDPDLGRDIVSLGFIKNLQIEGGKVSFTVELTTPACPVKETFRQRCEAAVKALPGVESVNVTMGAQERRPRPGADINTLESVDAVIAVSSSKGGVGKSTVAGQLARAMQREGLAVGLLDADIYGPSVPTLFNLHHPQLYMRDNKLLPVEVDGLKLMSLGFVLGESPAVLRGPIVSGYTQQILRQTDWGKLDYLIIDMPPGTGDIQLTIVQQAALDGAIIVTTPHTLSLVDVAKGILMFEKVQVPVLGVVENMCSFQCGECGTVHYPFGKSQSSLQQRFGLETLAELPILAGIADLSHADAGADVPALAALAEKVHRAIGKSRAEQGPPAEVSVRDDKLHVSFSDGTETDLDMRTVRLACPCALCVDENTGEQILQPENVPQSVRVEGIQTLGNYAVSFAWNDGHTTGIYSWEYLKALAEGPAAVGG